MTPNAPNPASAAARTGSGITSCVAADGHETKAPANKYQVASSGAASLCICGIDPGLSGGGAFYFPCASDRVAAEDMAMYGACLDPAGRPLLTRALGGNLSGLGVLCPGPNHSARDRSLSVTPSIASQDGFVVHSHAGDDWRECHKYVCARLGIAPFPPQSRPLAVVPELSAVALTTIGIALQRPSETAQNNNEAEKNYARAMRMWEQAIDPRETLVETYL